MKILYLNTLFDGGGAEKIARQIYQQIKGTVQAHYIVGFNTAPVVDRNVSVLYDGTPMRIFNRLITRNHCHDYDSLGYSRRRILKTAKKENVDIIHLHNAHGHYLGLKDIAKLAESYPFVWTIHDCWIGTGHCASPYDCSERTNRCANCPHVEYYPPVKNIGKIRAAYEKKRQLCQNENISFVVPSQWMKDILTQDMIPKEKVQVIHNGIDTDEFVPLDKTLTRKELGIPENKQIVGVIAAQLGIKLKGMHLFLEAIKQLPEIDRYHFVIAGGGDEMSSVLSNEGISHSYIGYLHGGKALSSFYSSLDILVNPSLAESFGLVNVEAMACGTPPVVYDIGPMREIVAEDVGWIAPECTAESLASAIQTAFTDDAYKKKAQKCIRYVHEHFSLQKMVQAYLDLYEQLKIGE